MGGFRQGFGLVLAQGLVLAIATPSAWAAPKTVAIVNLCQTLDGRQAAESARRSLERVDELRPIQVGDLSRALETPLDGDDPTQPILKASRAALVQSDKAFLRFQNRQAKSELDKARRQLFSLAPSEASNKMLADLSLRMAQVHLRAQNRGLALGELQLLHRLVPKRPSLDPVRYPPDVVEAYETGRKLARTSKKATLRISATYDGAPVFVDGVKVGVSPVELSLGAGSHVVTVAAPEFQTAARQIELDPKDNREERFDLVPRSPVQRARELRFAVRQAAESARDQAVLDAAASTAQLVGSDAVLVIRDHKGVARASLYDPTHKRLSFSRPVNAQLSQLFGLVVAVGEPTLINERPGGTDKPWYLQWWGLSSIAGGVTAAAIASFAVTAGDDARDDRAGIPTFPGGAP